MESAASLSPAELAELAKSILDTHHAYLHEHMPRLGTAFRRSPPRLKQAWTSLQFFLEDHMMKEEQILFPHLQAMCTGDVSMLGGVLGPIPAMIQDHQQIERMMAELRACAGEAGEHEPALTALLDDLHEHAHKEDERLFPAALRLARSLAGLPEEEPVEPGPSVAAPPPRVARRAAAAPVEPPPRAGLLRRAVRRLVGGKG